MIRLVGVTSRVGGRVVLDEVTLHARAGELTLVEAGRAAGKTTLLRVVAGLRRPDAGEVWIGDRDIARLQRSSLPFVRRNVGYLPPVGQPALLARETLIENVMLALGVRGLEPAPAREVARKALERFGLEGCAGRTPEEMSAGERRLAALARAIAGAPAVLVLDDPAVGLGPVDVGTALSALLGAAEAGAAVLCASPEGAFVTAAARAGGRRVRLEGGRVVGGARPVAVGAAPRRPEISEKLDITVEEAGVEKK